MGDKTKITIGVGVAATGIFSLTKLIAYLLLLGAVITSPDGNQICSGTIEDPCISHIFISNISATISNPEGIKLEFLPGIKDYDLYVANYWNETVTSTYNIDVNNVSVEESVNQTINHKDWILIENMDNFSFDKEKTYEFELRGYKYNPSDNIKWTLTGANGNLDPWWNSSSGQYDYARGLENNSIVYIMSDWIAGVNYSIIIDNSSNTYASNPNNVFLLYDNFTESSLNTTKWTAVGGANITTNGYYNITGAGTGKYAYSKSTFLVNGSNGIKIILKGRVNNIYGSNQFSQLSTYGGPQLPTGFGVDFYRYNNGVNDVEIASVVNASGTNENSGTIVMNTPSKDLIQTYLVFGNKSSYLYNSTYANTTTSVNVTGNMYFKIGGQSGGAGNYVSADYVEIMSKNFIEPNIVCSNNVCNFTTSVNLTNYTIPLQTSLGGNLNVQSSPTQINASVNISTTTGSAPLNVSFSVIIYNGTPPYTYNWSLSNGTFITSNNNGSYIFNNNGVYNLTLKITGNNNQVFNNWTIINVTYFGNLSLSINNFTRNITAELGSLLNISSNVTTNSYICLDLNHPDYGVNYVCNYSLISFNANITYFRNNLMNDSSSSKNLSYSGNQNITFGISSHQYDEVVGLKVNLTLYQNVTLPSGLLIYINNTLSNNISLISTSLVTTLSDGTNSKDIPINPLNIKSGAELYLPKNSTINNASLYINGSNNYETLFKLPSAPYVVIEALSLNTAAFTYNGCNISNFTDPVTGNKRWVVWDNVSSDTYEVKRAKMYDAVFFSDYAHSFNGPFTGSESVSMIATTDSDDVGYRAYRLYAYANAPGSTSYTVGYQAQFNVNSTRKTSVWFNSYEYYANSYSYMGLSNLIYSFYTAGGFDDKLNTDQSSLELANASGIKVKQVTSIGSVGGVYTFFLTDLSVGQMTISATDHSCPFAGILECTFLDYSTNYNLPAMTYWQENYTTTNPWMKVGSLDGTFDFNYTGKYIGYTKSNDFSNSINNYLLTCVPNSNGYCLVPIYFGSNNDGGLIINNISVDVNINNNPITLNKTLISNYLNNSVGFVNIPITIHSDTAGIVQVNDIKYDYRGGNKTYIATAHNNGYQNSTNYSITFYYTKYDYKMPNNIDYFEFLPKNQNSKNVSPFKQTNTTPIFNFTMMNYGGSGNISIYINESYSCINLSYGLNGSSKILLNNGSWININTNLNISNNFGLWFIADYQCNNIYWQLWNPNIFFRSCPYNVDVCDQGLI